MRLKKSDTLLLSTTVSLTVHMHDTHRACNCLQCYMSSLVKLTVVDLFNCIDYRLIKSFYSMCFQDYNACLFYPSLSIKFPNIADANTITASDFLTSSFFY